jgi:hypothetical protein
MGDSMGGKRGLGVFARLSDSLHFLRRLLEGQREESLRPPWMLDTLEKVLAMWPVAPHAQVTGQLNTESTFAHLRRLYRYGFRLTVAKDGLRLRQFFADGQIYRPEGYSRDSVELLADLQHLAKEKNPLKPGQCRVARARPVLNALGFPDLDSAESYAVQFAWSKTERWIFIDSRPELFRRETAAGLAAKLAMVLEPRPVPGAEPIHRNEGPAL